MPCLQSWQTGVGLEQDSHAIKSIPDIGIQRSFITICLATNDGMNCVLQEIQVPLLILVNVTLFGNGISANVIS